MNDILFAAARLDCRFGAVHAIRDATCTIRVGQHIAVSGPAGSGKSTLLHVIAGLQEPTSGSVTWPDLGSDPRHERTLIAVVFQAPSLLEPLDVVQNVQLPLLLAGVDTITANLTAIAALTTVGLADLGSRMPAELSSGQAQRVAVARALAMRPRLILADEPTAQLDTDTGNQVMSALVKAAKANGAALVVATHDEDIADRMPRRWRMHDGELDIRTPHHPRP